MSIELQAANIPQELKLVTRWIPANKDKRPIIKGSWATPEAWSTFDEVHELCQDGKAKWPCLVAGGGYVLVDLDNVLSMHSEGVDWVSQEAKELIVALKSYTEISPSGKGVRVILKGNMSLDGNKIPLPDAEKSYIEWWGGENNRFCTVTGYTFKGCDTITELTDTKERRLLAFLKNRAAPAKLDHDVPLPLIIRDDAMLKELRAPLIDTRMWAFLVHGDATQYRDDRSAALLGVASSLYMRNYNDSQVFSVMVASPHVMQAALDRRPDERQAMEWLWEYTCLRARVNSASEIVAQMDVPQVSDDHTVSAEDVVEKALAEVTAWDSPSTQSVVDYIRGIPESSISRPALMERLNLSLGGNQMAEVKRICNVTMPTGAVRGGNLEALPPEAEEWVYLSGEHSFVNTNSMNTLSLAATSIQLNIPKLSAEKVRAYVAAGHIEYAENICYIPGRRGVVANGGVNRLSSWKPSPILPCEDNDPDVAPWLHLFDMLGIVEEEHVDGMGRNVTVHIREHILDWMAHTVQKPEGKIFHAILMCGVQGCGKDSLLQPLSDILGENYSAAEVGSVSGDFNGYLSSAKVLQINELCPGRRDNNVAFANSLKTVIAPSAQGKILINPKYGRQYEIDNYVNVIAHTNFREGLYMEEGERRWFCVECSPGKSEVCSDEYQDMLEDYHDWREDGGTEKVYRFLLNRDISKFKPSARPPRTHYLEEIISGSHSGLKNQTMDTLNEYLANRTVINLQEIRDFIRRPENTNLFFNRQRFTDGILTETIQSLGFSMRRAQKGRYYVRMSGFDVKGKDLEDVRVREEAGEVLGFL